MRNKTKTARKATANTATENTLPNEVSPTTEFRIDPLYTIFEKYLYEFTEFEKNEQEFVDRVISDYLRYLTSKKVVVAQKWRHLIVEELRDQVRQMMFKKTYGCLSVQEYILNQKDLEENKKSAKKKYSKLF